MTRRSVSPDPDPRDRVWASLTAAGALAVYVPPTASMRPAQRPVRLSTRGLGLATVTAAGLALAALAVLAPVPDRATTVRWEDGSSTTYVDGVAVSSTPNDPACDC